MNIDVIKFILAIVAFLFAFVSYFTHLRHKGYLCGTLHSPSSEQREKRISLMLHTSYATGILFYICLFTLWAFDPTFKTAFYCLLILCVVVSMSVMNHEVHAKVKKLKHDIIMCEGKNCLLKQKCYRYFSFEHYHNDCNHPKIIPFCDEENRPGYIHEEDLKGGEE